MSTLAASTGDHVGYRILLEYWDESVELPRLVAIDQRMEKIVANDEEGRALGFLLFERRGKDWVQVVGVVR